MMEWGEMGVLKGYEGYPSTHEAWGMNWWDDLMCLKGHMGD